MNRKIRIARNALFAFFIIVFVAYSSLVITWWSTTSLVNLINETTSSSPTIVPKVFTKFIMFNFRGGKKDIDKLKMDYGGLNYIASALSNSKFSKDKKAKYIKYFISRGCGVNDISSIDGLTPLHEAAMFGDAETTELLLENGADPLLKAESPKGFKGLVTYINMTPLGGVELKKTKFTYIDYTKVIEVLRKAEDKRRQTDRLK